MKFELFSLLEFFPDRQNEVRYYQDTLDLIIRAEQLGFDSVWLGEEHFYTIGICPSPQIFLTAVARETSRIRLGTSISLLPFENPLRKAEDFAMLDILSNGRLNFGVGRGIITKHFEGFRVPSAESRDRFEKALAIIRRAWMQDPVEYTGQFWSVLSLSPKPVQRPHPPMYRGVVSMTGSEGAGRAGDHLLLAPWITAPHPTVWKSVTRYRELLKEHGHGPKRATWVFWLFIDLDHDVAVREGRDITRNYTDLFGRILIPELLAGRSEMQTNGATEDLFQQFLDFAQAMPDELEQRAVVGTPADHGAACANWTTSSISTRSRSISTPAGATRNAHATVWNCSRTRSCWSSPRGGLSLFGSPWAAVALQRGLLPLHASAVSRAGAVHAFSGASGGGKSTLAAALGRHGLPFFADDLLLLDPASFGEGCLCYRNAGLKLFPDALALTAATPGAPVYQACASGGRVRCTVRRASWAICGPCTFCRTGTVAPGTPRLAPSSR